MAIGWDRLHPRLTHRAAWLDHPGDLPVLEGTLICLTVERLPGDRAPKPVWLCSSRTGAAPSHVDRLWQAYLRRARWLPAVRRPSRYRGEPHYSSTDWAIAFGIMSSAEVKRGTSFMPPDLESGGVTVGHAVQRLAARMHYA